MVEQEEEEDVEDEVRRQRMTKRKVFQQGDGGGN